MRQLTINCADDFNFYMYHYYLNQLNQYGEKQFDDSGKLLITKRELKKLIGQEMGIPASRLKILETHL